MYAEANIDPLSCVQYFCNRLASTPMLVNFNRRLLGTLSPRKCRRLFKVIIGFIIVKSESPPAGTRNIEVVHFDNFVLGAQAKQAALVLLF